MLASMLTLLILSSLPAGTPGHSVALEYLPDGSALVAETTVPGDLPASPASDIVGVRVADAPSESHRAASLWVDRAHRNAIAEETVINGHGSGIFTSWYLNNPRLSRYVTCGSATPQWSYPISSDALTVDIAAAADLVWSATNRVAGTFAWLDSGSSPSFTASPGLRQDISEDGSRLVFVGLSNNLVCINTSTQTVLWSVPLHTVGNGINGVDISSDASRVLVSAYEASTGAQVYNMSNGALVGSPVGNYSQTKGAISGDGSRIVLGDFNGRVRMYEWSGSSWQLAAQIASGHSWVTAVAISDDGMTVAAGTLGFSPNRGKVLCIDWPSSGTPTTSWQYTDYGDEVASVAVCDDGSVIVAGSWGQFGATSGDVFTAFDHDGGIIFQLLDDTDEPGSIFSVDVSDDGAFATAGGKAVHAREMGNGGQVYSIQIMPTQQHDVAVVAVISPTENQQVGNTITPQVTVSNMGQSTESFSVSATIKTTSGTTVWSGSASVSSLGPDQNRNVSFSSWTVPSYGSWVFSAQTLLSGDTYHANDTLSVGLRAYHDAAVLSIARPYAENTVNMAMTPLVLVKNCGTYSENISLTMTIDLAGSQVYNQTQTLPTLAPGATLLAPLPSWTPSSVGAGLVEASVTVTDDFVSSNDDASLPIEIVYEIIYDDGEWDSYYWVGSLQDDMFATRFTPTISTPFIATRFRVFVNSTEPFSWAGLYPDNGSGRPDLSNPYYYVENISAPSAMSWLEVPMNVWINEPGDLWFVTHWPDAKSLAIGGDNDDPIDGRSWWHNASSGWTNYTSADWSFRLTLEPSFGMEGGETPLRFSLGIPRPNPMRSRTSISVSVPTAGGAARLAVYDLAGRCVNVLNDGALTPGVHEFEWNGLTQDGSAAPSGLYFVRLDAPGCRSTGRLALIR
ncbi:MAG: flagellar basal body rod modification protein [candidate division Hyd24-12 bacterium ADurb.Bin004]|nr:MAG: flagellar basal body rod modification protein [candidate division Hyd24-12 bacterium ADurb.Bin004]